MDDSIRHCSEQCVRGFKSLCTALTNQTEQSQEELLPEVVNDLFGRFNVWAGNIGAGQRGQASLDYRLREASSIKDHVCGTLRSLLESIEDATSIISGSRTPYDQLSSDSDSSTSSLSTTSVQDDMELQLSAEELSAEDGARTELQQLQHSIETFVSNLYKISIIIRQSPSSHDRTTRAAKIDTSFYNPFDQRHVQEKYPGMNAALAERLANANSRRRKYFKYREQHRQRLSHRDAIKHSALAEPLGPHTHIEPDPKILPRGQQTTPSIAPDQSVIQPSVTVQSTRASTFHARDASAVNLDTFDQQSVAESYTTSGSLSSTKQERLAIPPMPGSAQGRREFECPYCYTICFVKSFDDYGRKKEWKHHVLRDLQPYICTFGSCPQAHTMFERRRDWFNHEMQVHRVEWCCNTPGHRAYGDRSEFQTHLKGHGESYDDGQLELMIDIFKRPAVELAVPCPICKDQRFRSLSIEKLEEHIGRHLEMISIFALPLAGHADSSSGSIITQDAIQNDHSSTETTDSVRSDGAKDAIDHRGRANVQFYQDVTEGVDEVQQLHQPYLRDLHEFLEETRQNEQSLNCSLDDLLRDLPESSVFDKEQVMLTTLPKLRTYTTERVEVDAEPVTEQGSIHTSILLLFVKYARTVIVNEMLIPESNPEFHALMRNSLRCLTSRIMDCYVNDPQDQQILDPSVLRVRQSLQRLDYKLSSPEVVEDLDQDPTRSNSGAHGLDEGWDFMVAEGNPGLRTSLNLVQGNTETDKTSGDVRNEFYDQSKFLAQTAAQRSSGTAEWIFEFPSFLDLTKGLRRFLLLEGLPGCGKTILCSSVVQSLRRNSAVCAFYFFQQFTDGFAIESVLRTLMLQLMEQTQDISADLVDLIAKQSGGKLDLEELLDMFQTMSTLFHEVFIVLDGLDQCSKEAMRTISYIVQMTIQKGTQVRILATSRFDLNVADDIRRKQLDQPGKMELQWHNNFEVEIIPREVVQDDIVTMIKSSHHSRNGKDIACASRGIFLWASARLRQFERGDIDDSVAALSAVTPPEIEDLWSTILDSLEALLDADDRPTIIEVLGLLSVSQRSLNAEEIEGYLSYNSVHSTWGKYRFPDRFTLWWRYPPLLQLAGQPKEHDRPSGSTENLGFVHPSLQDRIRFHFDVDPIRWEKEVADRCVSWLLRYLSPSFYTSIQGWTAYAGTYWHEHVKRLGNGASELLIANSVKLLDHQTPSFSHWTYMTRRGKGINTSEDGDFGKQGTYPPPLYYAALLGLHECALELIKNGADVNARGGRHEYPVVAAVVAGSEETVEVLVSQLAAFRVAAVKDVAALQASALDMAALKAVTQGQSRMLQTLLANGADCSYRDEYDRTMADRATESNNLDCLRLLAESGAKLDSPDTAGITPLHLASSVGAIACMEFLLSHGVDVNARIESYSRSALLVAAGAGQNDALEVLLANGAKVDWCDSEGKTALCYASERLNPPMVISLLEAGANPNWQADRGTTPLHMAVDSEVDPDDVANSSLAVKAVVKKLLEHGADRSIRDGNDIKVSQAPGLAVYEGYRFEKLPPQQSEDKGNKQLFTETRMSLSQRELRVVINRQGGPSTAYESLKSAQMEGFERTQVERLVDDRIADDPRSHYDLVSLKLEPWDDEPDDRNLRAFEVILKRQPQICLPKNPTRICFASRSHHLQSIQEQLAGHDQFSIPEQQQLPPTTQAAEDL
ncbi:MAG: hypothetical protein Q9169_004356 [Polycauliona sp. 2 TL-2023]